MSTKPTGDQIRRAQLAAAHYAQDAEDLRILLLALGLHPGHSGDRAGTCGTCGRPMMRKRAADAAAPPTGWVRRQREGLCQSCYQVQWLRARRQNQPAPAPWVGGWRARHPQFQAEVTHLRTDQGLGWTAIARELHCNPRTAQRAFEKAQAATTSTPTIHDRRKHP